jgi:hypothetical protein
VRADLRFPAVLTDEHRDSQQELHHWRTEETRLQPHPGTKPQTLAYALTDSRAGLAACIGEKFHSWTDRDGELETAIELDWVLTNITL